MKKIFLAAILFSVICFSSCKTGGGDPKAVLSEFFQALADKDMEKARKLATTDSKSMLDMMAMAMKTENKEETDKYDKANMEYGDAKIDGDVATVPVKEKTSGETLNYTLKKESGTWKVAFDKASIMSMGMDKMKEKGVDVSEGLNKAAEEMRDMNIDSLKEGMEKGSEALDSMAKVLEKMKQ